MTKEQEALKLALEAWAVALEETLAQPPQPPLPVQEPVAHVYLFDHDGKPRVAWDNAKGIKIGDRLYATSPAAQPAQKWSWVCNECGAQEFTSALSEADLEYLACAGCGCNEFHKEALAQPVQGLDEAAIRADEREACAKVCEINQMNSYACAKLIRARGNT
jgi:hypothetical protein